MTHTSQEWLDGVVQLSNSIRLTRQTLNAVKSRFARDSDGECIDSEGELRAKILSTRLIGIEGKLDNAIYEGEAVSRLWDEADRVRDLALTLGQQFHDPKWVFDARQGGWIDTTTLPTPVPPEGEPNHVDY